MLTACCFSVDVNSHNNSVSHTILFAIAVAVVLGAIVTAVSVFLEPAQAENRERAQQAIFQDLLENQPGFENIADRHGAQQMEHRLVDLDTGCYDIKIAASDYAQSVDPRQSKHTQALTREQDIATIKLRAKYALVHLIRDADRIIAVVLPVYGLGYSSRLSGYLTLAADGNSIRSLVFYDHNETPGMGGRISTADWQVQWQNKSLRDESGNLRIGVAASTPTSIENRPYQIDAMTGATITGRGVTNLLRFWLGPMGFETFLYNLSTSHECIR
ncbi:MAG: NADH:ubiquinone reductase (Na(+)-transporting) subunit C [Pseudomonadales bacterium]